jgi:hypothetical protein
MKRGEMDYALKVLEEKCALIRSIGHATDRPELAEWQVNALRATMAYLRQPRFAINPLV